MNKISTITRSILLSLFFSCLSILAFTQSAQIEQARQYATEGKHVKANEVLKDVLSSHPGQREAKMLQAHNFAWWHKFDHSIATFKQILSEDINNLEAWKGLGYAYAWSGEFKNAQRVFDKVLSLDPMQSDALVGKGHTYIMSGKGAKAEEIFKELISEEGRKANYYNWLGIAHLHQYELGAAQAAFETALSLEEGNTEARSNLKKLDGLPPPWEASVWAGYSTVDNLNKFGLRLAQLTYRMNQSSNIYLRYDNSLGLDNADFILRDHNVNAISAGGIYNWSRYASRLQYGLRFFPDNAIQHQIAAEQVFFLSNNYSVRTGGMLGLSEQVNDEYIFYVGGYIPVNSRLALEPSYFYSDINAEFGRQHRFLMAGKYRTPKGYEVMLGGMYGNTDIPPDLEIDDQIAGLFGMVILPVSSTIWTQLGFQYEKGTFEESLALAGGLQFRLGK